MPVGEGCRKITFILAWFLPFAVGSVRFRAEKAEVFALGLKQRELLGVAFVGRQAGSGMVAGGLLASVFWLGLS